MKNYCGIILIKADSQRLPNKNYLEVNGKKLWEYAYHPLRAALGRENVFLFHEGVGRPPAASIPNEPLFSALKWAYKTLPKRYDAIINIMANCPQHTAKGIHQAIQTFEDTGSLELRSFSSTAKESGLLILEENHLLTKHEISTYQSAITLNSPEIHTQKDLDKWQQL